jgi:hypothetical protein|tara:strand:+ start:1086 stop:1310 length:225 start_codon:yes stop_codon:yes gene_type:complete
MIKYTIHGKTGKEREVELTPLKAIRFHCLQCVGWHPSDVKHCTGKFCPLHPYRFGTNPEREGIGGKSYSKRVAE